MKVLVVDVNNVIRPNINNLKNLSYVLSWDRGRDENGLILVLKDGKIDKKRIRERMSYIDSEEFIKSIQSFYYFNYKNNICELPKINKAELKEVVKELERTFPKVIIVVKSKEESEIFNFLSEGFENPHYCKGEICLAKGEKKGKLKASDELQYLLSQNGNGCSISVYIDKECSKYLRSLTEGAKTKNKDGTFSQKEVFGIFQISKSAKGYKLNVDRKRNEIGDEEEVLGVSAIFNFHTHPREAYENNKVEYGWPSSQDFVGFMYMALSGKTVFHCVVTLEGIYILSLNTHQIGDIAKRIKHDYDVYERAPSVNTPEKFVEYIKSIKDNVFGIQFHTWKEIEGEKIISVSFSKTGGNCFINDQTLQVARYTT